MKNKSTHGNGHILNNEKGEKFLYQRILNKSNCTNVWFFFPGPESFALSSLGYLWLFKELDEQDNIDVERVYADSKTTRIMKDKIDAVGISTRIFWQYLNSLRKTGLNLNQVKEMKILLSYTQGGQLLRQTLFRIRKFLIS